ncbi:putative heme utilization radical SAM enzyme HutW [Rhodobaculum claviforme]|uniref:Heme utilization radical SAM enzyme HutW n=1 Tax=Rhodobaculum claviforme TaxID=1549854 RepID=A0A934WJ93_9RHOB|nr:putative heme utilization radical SAM enzyme HutW [Rhodobaculum claviforme]
MAARWQAMAATPRTGSSVAYVHVPFCANRCLFCGFYQNPWRAEAGAPYVDRLIEQLAGGAATAMQRGHPLRAVYLGGGTPTALAADDLARLIRALRRHLPLAPDCEITLEGRVFDFGAEKAAAALDAGATRISIGVQSFDDRLRRSLGRKTSGDEVRRALCDLVAMDRGAIVIDLMYGLPGQTPALWQADLDTATGLGLDGVDLYALKLIPGTPLLRALENGKRPPFPAGALGHFHALGAAHMARAGWEAISCTHWRRGTRERNTYNLQVKTGAACLAFGAGAGGTHAGHSWRTLPGIDAWAAALADGRPPVAGLMQASPLQPLIDAIRAGMELGRLDLPAVEAACSPLAGPGFAALVAPLTRQWTLAGLMEPDGPRLGLTLAGRFWQVAMTQRLIDWTRQELADATHPGTEDPR